MWFLRCVQENRPWRGRTTAWMRPRRVTWTTRVRNTARLTSAPAPAACPPLRSATKGSATRPCASSSTRWRTPLHQTTSSELSDLLFIYPLYFIWNFLQQIMLNIIRSVFLHRWSLANFLIKKKKHNEVDKIKLEYLPYLSTQNYPWTELCFHLSAV